jgi:hypothetical protein
MDPGEPVPSTNPTRCSPRPDEVPCDAPQNGVLGDYRPEVGKFLAAVEYLCELPKPST